MGPEAEAQSVRASTARYYFGLASAPHKTKVCAKRALIP